MSEDGFRVTFHGEVIEGFDPDEVKANMAQIFKLDLSNQEHVQKLDKLFSGRTVIIKADLSVKTAQIYVDAIAKAGGIASIHPSDVPPPGIRERRSSQRRLQGDRRRSPRLSSILPDRRKARGRRRMDLCG